MAASACPPHPAPAGTHHEHSEVTEVRAGDGGGANGTADYVAPFSPPASIAVQKVKVPGSGHGVEPWATVMGRVRVKRPPPSAKTGQVRAGGGSPCHLHLAPTHRAAPRVPPAAAPSKVCPHLLSPRPSQPVGVTGLGYLSQAEALGTTWGLRALEGRCPWGALPSPYLKTNLRSPSQRETLSPTSGCRRHVQHVCQFKSRDPSNPQRTARPGRATLPLPERGQTSWAGVSHTDQFIWWLCAVCVTQSC